MPRTPKPNNPAQRGGGALEQAAKTAQQQLAGQPLAPAAPTTVTVGNTTTTLTGRYGPPQDPFNRRGGAPEQPAPPPGWDVAAEDLSQLPNWEKLSGTERFVMGLLPGISTTLKDAYKNFDDWTGGLAGLVVGSKPVKVTTTAIGGALAALDVGAEFTERSYGILRQYLDATQDPARLDEFKRNFKSAWYAGTLASDSANVDIAFGPDGITIPNDLGGAGALVQARQRIADLVAQGTSYHDAAIMARDEYYSSLGALAIRAQLQDLTWHLVVDPLNVILGAVKPIERLHVLRGKLVGLEATAEELAALEKTAETAREGLKLAEAGSDTEALAQAQQAVTRAEQALEFANQTTLSPAEQRLAQLFGRENIVKLTGGAPDAPIPKPTLANAFNLFALTPQARAHEILTIVRDFAVSHVLTANRNAEGVYDVEGIVRGLQRIADGTHAPELGHAIASIEGRTFRGITRTFAAQADELLASWQATGRLERPLLDLLGQTLGVSPYEIIKRLDKGENAAVLAQFTEKLASVPDAQAAVTQLLQANNLAALTPDVLARLGNVLGGKAFAGYTDQLFVAELMGKLTDAAAQQAVVQFGVKARGIVQDMAELVKAGEALAFLKTNPGYPIRNFINNNVTLIARGAFGTTLDTSAKAFENIFGFVPPRYSEGVGAVDVLETLAKGTPVPVGQVDEGARVIAEAGKGDTLLNRLSDKIKRINLGPADMTRHGAGIERLASERAYFTYFTRHFPQAYRGLLGKLADFAPETFGQLPRTVLAEIESAFVNANTEAKLADLFTGENLKLNFENFVARAERDSGLKLDQVLGMETVQPLREAVETAAKTGDRAALETAVREFGAGVQAHIDDLVEGGIATMRDEAAARAAAEGPGAFGKVWADAMDEFWSSHERHALDIQQAVELARKSKGAAADAIWQESRENARAFFGRQFDRIEARVAGFTEKATELGLPGAEQISAQLKEWRAGWEGFFAKRDSLWDAFWQATRAGETPPVKADVIQQQLDDAYRLMVDKELRYQRAIDSQMAQMLPPEQQPLFQAWRNRVNEYRAADKESVIAFRQQIRGLRSDQFEAAYSAHWKDRITAWNRLRNEEQAGLAAMLGSQPAREHFVDSVALLQADELALDALRTRMQAGESLTIDEAQQLSALLDKHATPAEAARLRELDSADMADQLNPPMVPTPEGAAMLEADLRKAAAQDTLAGIVDSLDSPTIKSIFARGSTPEQPTAKMLWVKQDADRLVWSETHPGAGAQISWKGDPKVWHRIPANEVDGWVEQTYEKLGGDLTGGEFAQPSATEMWDEIVAAYRQRKGVNADARMTGGAGDIPTQVDVNSVEFRNAERASERNFIQAQISQRLTDQRTAQATAQGGGEFVQQEALAARIKAGESWDSVLSQFPEAERESMRGAIEMAMAGATRPRARATMPDLEQVVKPELYNGVALDQLWYTRGQDAVRAIKQAALDIMDEAPSRWADLPENVQDGLRAYAQHAQGAVKDARYAAMRMGEFGRDSALLNYNRRFNYNTLLGTLAPFEFWSTQSAWKWAMHSIDRPGMAAAYLRLRKFLETAYRPEEGLPTRLRGNIRIPLPFMPEWMGNEVFVDPLRIGLPFDNWMAPVEQKMQDDISDRGAASRKLEELYHDGEIDQADYQNALQTQSGPAWERALSLARQDDTEGRMTWSDTAAALFPPHVPLLYAMDALNGKNPFEERGPLLPLTRNLGNLLAVLGVDPAGPLNPEAALRKQFGLHPFSKWDDYLTERMLTNMVATGELGLDEAKRAMVEHQGPAWDEALRRAGVERAGGNLITAAMGLSGIPAKGYPPGEEANRKLQDDYGRAWDAYNASGGDYAGTVGAWLKDHPGYEARLALFKKPEERLQQFMVDEFWDIWNGLPKLTRDQLQEQLGPQFSDTMFSADTGWGKNADPAKLATWLKLMGGDPPGTLAAADGATLDLASPETAQRAQVFYNVRDQQYPGWREAQDGYFALTNRLEQQLGVSAALVKLEEAGDDKKARAQVFREYPALGDYFDARKAATSEYLNQHPVLSAYWQWRDSFLARNSDVAPYLSDKPVYAERATSRPQFNYTRAEWQQTLGTPLFVIALYAAAGDDVRGEDEADLLAKAAALGWTGSVDDLAQLIAEAR